MTYAIKNGPNFSAAFAGAMAGMEGSGLGSGKADGTAADYSENAGIAFAFAQQVDTVLGSTNLAQPAGRIIKEAAFAAFKDRNPSGGASVAPDNPLSWTEEANAIAAIVLESGSVIVALATGPNPIKPAYQSASGKNAAATVAAHTTTYDVSADIVGGYLPATTGFLLAIFTMSVLDATIDLAITFQARIAAAADAASPQPTADGGDIGDACVTIARVYPIAAGVAVNPGIQATAANNVQSAIGSVGWSLLELQ